MLQWKNVATLGFEPGPLFQNWVLYPLHRKTKFQLSQQKKTPPPIIFFQHLVADVTRYGL